MRRPPRRPGFTLLEVLLAAAIATLLLGALYFAMDMTLRQTQEGRDAVEVDNVARAVFNRMAIDMGASLTPLPPKSGGNAAAGTAGGTGATYSSAGVSSTTSTGTASTGTASTGSTSSTATTSSSSSVVGAAGTTTGTSTGGPQADLGFQGGIVGTDTQLTVFVSRLPHALTDNGALLQPSDPNVQTPSDLYRVTYWKGSNGQLCRQERAWVTADGVRDTFEPDLTTEAGDSLADEVTDVQFEYFDGSGWTASWDGTTPGPDGVTPQGPPRAVRVTLTLTVPPSRPGTPPYTQTAIQVIPIRAAPGLSTPQLILPDLDPGTTSSGGNSGSSSSGSSGGSSSGGAGSMSSGGGASSGGAMSSGSPTSGAGGGGSSAGAKGGGATGSGSSGSKGGGR